MIGTAVLLVILLALSGFFSGSEIAMFSISQARARALVEENRRGAHALVALKSKPESLLITILIGNNVANIAAASVATYATTQAFGSAGVGLATGFMTLLVLFFGEVTPKSFAVANAIQISLFAAPILQVLVRVLYPLVLPIEAVTRWMLPKRSGASHGVTEVEIRRLTQMAYVAGMIEEHEQRLIERAFLLDQTQVWEAMTPRVAMFAWKGSLRLADIAEELRHVPHSRIPIYEESLDKVTGVLYMRDAYQALSAGRRRVPLQELAREPFFVPESMPLSGLLAEFQARRMHIGIVLDEYGGTDGLITLEDILEELVGEIDDEVDVPREDIVRLGRNEVLVDGSADLREVNHFFNTTFPLVEHRSLNGYLLGELGRVPSPGEVIEREGVKIEVLSASDTQVLRCRLVKKPLEQKA